MIFCPNSWPPWSSSSPRRRRSTWRKPSSASPRAAWPIPRPRNRSRSASARKWTRLSGNAGASMKSPTRNSSATCPWRQRTRRSEMVNSAPHRLHALSTHSMKGKCKVASPPANRHRSYDSWIRAANCRLNLRHAPPWDIHKRFCPGLQRTCRQKWAQGGRPASSQPDHFHSADLSVGTLSGTFGDSSSRMTSSLSPSVFIQQPGTKIVSGGPTFQ